jgi:hypothetical protein
VPDHPDQEQLAAYQAGDVDRRERLDVEAHLAGCPSCAELVASVGRARGSLDVLEEPDLPAGLHDRVAAAVEAEVAAASEAGAGAAGAEPGVGRIGSRQRAGSRNGSRSERSGTWRRSGSRQPGSGQPGLRQPPGAGRSGQPSESEPSGAADPERRVLRPAPWYRRPVAWGAAAALLLAALVVPFLTQSGVRTTAGTDTGAGGAAQEAASPQGQVAAGNLPVFRVQGEVTADTVRERLAADPRAQAALDSAGTPGATDQDQGAFRSSAQAPQADTPQRQSCLPAASAAADPATRPLVPAFFIEGTYKGRDATILVTTSTPQPSRVDLWVFPRDNCTSPLLATKRVR